jgi:sulfite reductase (ferredoxin)
MAELGLVGDTPGTYQVWLGGTPNQTALAQPYMDRMPVDQLEAYIEPILAFYKQKGKKDESFGEFCNRVGFDAIRDYASNYDPQQTVPTPTAGGKNRRHRISIYEGLHQRLKAAADERGTSMTKLVAEALEQYLDK